MWRLLSTKNRVSIHQEQWFLYQNNDGENWDDTNRFMEFLVSSSMGNPINQLVQMTETLALLI